MISPAHGGARRPAGAPSLCPRGRPGASADRHRIARVAEPDPDDTRARLGAGAARGRPRAGRPGRARVVARRDRARPRARPPARRRRAAVAALRAAVAEGADPLGEAFCRLRPPELRRGDGATYTPSAIVESMVAWAAAEGAPARVVDPGAGSGRFAVAAGRRFGSARARRGRARPAGGRGLPRPPGGGRPRRARDGARRPTTARPPSTASTGRPSTSATRPTSATTRSRPAGRSGSRSRRGRTASRRAGWPGCTSTSSSPPPRGRAPGDRGAFITSSEWLDTNYGRLVRELLLDGLGGEAIHVIEPTAMPFERRRRHRRHHLLPRGRAAPAPCACAGSRTSGGWGPWRAGGRCRPSACARRGAGRR